MKRFLLVFLVLLVGCFCLSAETIKGKSYEDGVMCIYTWSKYPTKDKSGIFSLSEAQELLESLGWDNYSMLKKEGDYFNDFENDIFDDLSDYVDFPEENNLIEIKMMSDNVVYQAYYFQIDWVYSNFNCNRGCYIDTLVFIREL